MFIKMFDIRLFNSYSDFGFYYLSNAIGNSPFPGLQYKTVEDI